MNKKQTSKSISSLASSVLKNSNSSKVQKSLAASALSQSKTKNQTGKKMETKASNVLKSSKFNNVSKKLAASILSQSNRNR